MNRNQKIVLMATAVVIASALHFSFCRWDFGKQYSLSEAWYILPHVSRQIVGVNSKIDHITVSFAGISCAPDSTKAICVSLGVAVPIALLGLCLFLSFTLDRSGSPLPPARPRPPAPPVR